MVGKITLVISVDAIEEEAVAMIIMIATVAMVAIETIGAIGTVETIGTSVTPMIGIVEVLGRFRKTGTAPRAARPQGSKAT